jgi:hypothetical protein
MRPSSFISSAACSSSGHAASCRPAVPATDFAPTAQRARHGSSTAASVCSLPGSDVCSGPLAALAAAAAAAAPIHSLCSVPPSTATATAVPPAAASTPPPLEFLSQLAAASPFPSPAAAPHYPRVSMIRSARVDAGAQTRLSQRQAHRGQLPPPQAAHTRPGRNSARRLLGHAAAAVAAVILACSVASSFAQRVAVSGTSGGWSTAALSQARSYLAATSLPDAGVVIFAGGQCTSCDGLFCVLRDGYGCEGDA